MSLLLDALKKAADDKEKKSIEESASQRDTEASVSDVQNVQAEKSASLSNDAAHFDTEIEKTPVENSIDELRLDDIAVENTESFNLDNESQQERELDLEQKEEVRPDTNNTHKTDYAISDEALSMLIYKTNNDIKRRRKVFVFVLLAACLAIILSGGAFYYTDMETEIETLERKHKIAMQSMRSKTNKEKTPEKTEIIRNLVSDAKLVEKVEYAKKHLAGSKPEANVQHKVPVKVKRQINAYNNTAMLSIERTRKVDHVGGKLDAAWRAYDNMHYKEAKVLYTEVLDMEKNNRDALLGLGAIAVIEKNHTVARNVYLSLLSLDPRDPIATAAIASLNNNSSSLESDEEYLLSMLKKNPNAPQLNFALGNISAQLKKWGAAQQYYFNAWQHDNENADYIFNLAVSMDQLSKQQQAVDFYKESLLKASNKQVSFSREAVKKRINELTKL